MRNNELQKIENWRNDIDKYIDSAKQYIETNSKRYPGVYFAKHKSGKWGITLPGVFNVRHSAVNCPAIYSSELHATAWMMKVNELYKMSPYTYLSWCQKYGWLKKGNTLNPTGVTYVHNVQNSERPLYEVCIPVEGKGYVRIMKSYDEPYFYNIKDAIKHRNQVLWKYIHSGRDLNGVTLDKNRIGKFQRELISGYFKGTFLLKEKTDVSREEWKDTYNSNKARLANAFANAARELVEDEPLKETFEFYAQVFDGSICVTEYSKLPIFETRVKEYFKAIDLWKQTQETVYKISRAERNRATKALNALTRKFA